MKFIVRGLLLIICIVNLSIGGGGTSGISCGGGSGKEGSTITHGECSACGNGHRCGGLLGCLVQVLGSSCSKYPKTISFHNFQLKKLL